MHAPLADLLRGGPTPQAAELRAPPIVEGLPEAQRAPVGRVLAPCATTALVLLLLVEAGHAHGV
jgi:hypothetical protein